MNTLRKIKRKFKSKPALEGAGVHLKRAFGYNEMPLFDPFLLLDDFRSANPDDYAKGFPWHPHRGIETITYVLRGNIEHGDSLGNTGNIAAGATQWMTAGSGIIHQEMPKGDEQGRMEGFQLWANLPARDKMMAPRYREIPAAAVPQIRMENGVLIKVICGRIGDARGPVRDVVSNPEYLDISIPAGAEYNHPTMAEHTVFAYVISGEVEFADGTGREPEKRLCDNETLVLFSHGDLVSAHARDRDARFLLISGQPIREPIAWRGPIVMNTREELRLAFKEYHNHTFIKKKD